MKNVTLFRAWLRPDTDKGYPIFRIMRDPYLLFGALCGKMYSGKIKHEELVSWYRRFGLRNKVRAVEAVGELEPLLNEEEFNQANLEEEIGRKLTGTDIKFLTKMNEEREAALSKGCLYWDRYIHNLKDSGKICQGGFITLKPDWITTRALMRRNGLTLQLYIYYQLAKAYSPMDVTPADWYAKGRKLLLKKDEVQSGLRTLADKFGCDKDSVIKSQKLLILESIIEVRRSGLGNVRIVKVLSGTKDK